MPALGPPLNAPFGVFKALPEPFGLGWGWAGQGRPWGSPGRGGGGAPKRPRGGKVIKIAVFWWTQVCQNNTMLGPETVLYGVN
jgi:hypothetical protein